MTANYKETTTTGTTWTRCTRVVVNNDFGELPYVLFFEQQVFNVGGSMVRDLGVLRQNFDPDGVIPLINPQTGEATGATITQAEAYAVLYSAYLQAAMARDAEEGGHD